MGVGVGVGIGMLFAPASGQKTRADISEKVKDVREKVRDRSSRKPQGASGTYCGFRCGSKNSCGSGAALRFLLAMPGIFLPTSAPARPSPFALIKPKRPTAKGIK
jgi:YtxH-like protein